MQSIIEATWLRRLGPADIQPFESAYLMGGFQQDRSTLRYVDILEDGIIGVVDVLDYAPSPEGFHFTAPLAFVWVAQLGIVYGCLDQGLPRKEGESFLRRFAIECRRTIEQDRGIPVVLKLRRRTRSHTRFAYYAGEFDIADGAFTGTASFVLALPALPDAKQALTKSSREETHAHV